MMRYQLSLNYFIYCSFKRVFPLILFPVKNTTLVFSALNLNPHFFPHISPWFIPVSLFSTEPCHLQIIIFPYLITFSKMSFILIENNIGLHTLLHCPIFHLVLAGNFRSYLHLSGSLIQKVHFPVKPISSNSHRLSLNQKPLLPSS